MVGVEHMHTTRLHLNLVRHISQSHNVCGNVVGGVCRGVRVREKWSKVKDVIPHGQMESTAAFLCSLAIKAASLRISQKPENGTSHMTVLSPTEEKVGFSCTATDGPAKQEKIRGLELTRGVLLGQ